jgi:hypothetical protein
MPGGVVRSKHFVTEPVELARGEEHRPEPRNCHLWICLAGHGTIDAHSFVPGDVYLVEGDAAIRAAAPARFLRTYVP